MGEASTLDTSSEGYWLVPDQLSGGPSIIGMTVVMNGELTLDEDLIIEGQFRGPCVDGARRLTIGSFASVSARIRSGSADIAGRVDGDFEGSETVVVRRTSSIRGTVTAADLRVEDGTNLEGTILSGRIRKVEERRPRFWR